MPRSNLITLQEWKSTYNIVDYNAVSGKGRGTELWQRVSDKAAFYFIVNILDEKKCTAMLMRLSKEQLTYCDTAYHSFTPLHVAVLLDKVMVVVHLLDKGCSHTAQDRKGFTPFRFSAFVGNDVYKAFTDRFRPDCFEAMHGAKIPELRKLITETTNTKYIENTFFETPSGKYEVMTSEKYFELTEGRTYTGKVIVKEQSLLWKKEKIESDNLKTLCTSLLNAHGRYAYLRFITHPPKVVIKKGSAFPKDEKGLGLFAGEYTKGNTILREYTGRLDKELPDFYSAKENAIKFTYWLGNVDVFEYGCGAELINDGFPQCHYLNVFETNGNPLVTCVLLLEDVKEGEEFFVDYGAEHPVKFVSYYHMTEVNRQKMHKFFRENSMQDILSEDANPPFPENVFYYRPLEEQTDIESYGKLRSRNNALAYFINTPFAIMDTIFSDIVDADDFLKVMNLSYFEKFVVSWISEKKLDPRVYFLVQCLSNLMKIINGQGEEQQKKIKKEFLDAIRELKVFQSLELVSKLGQNIDEFEKQISEPAEIKLNFQSLKETYAAMDWSGEKKQAEKVL